MVLPNKGSVPAPSGLKILIHHVPKGARDRSIVPTVRDGYVDQRRAREVPLKSVPRLLARPRNPIRKLFGVEEPLFRDHLLRLDPKSRHDRFLSGVSDSFLAEYARLCFGSNTLVLGYLQEDTLRAAGELHHIEPPEMATAEIAFSVEEDFRGRGIGKAMLKRLIVSARNRGIRHLRLNCHAENLAMQALARRFKAEFHIAQGGTEGEISSGRRSPYSLLAEALSDAREIARFAINPRKKL